MDQEPSRIINALNGISVPSNPLRKAVSKKGRRTEQFNEVTKAYLDEIENLITLAESLAKKGEGAEAAKLVRIITNLMQNNSKLGQVVGEALLDIPE